MFKTAEIPSALSVEGILKTFCETFELDESFWNQYDLMMVPFDETDALFDRLPVDVDMLYVVENSKQKREASERYELLPSKRLESYVSCEGFTYPLPYDWTVKNLLNQEALIIQYPENSSVELIDEMRATFSELPNVILCPDSIKFMDLQKVKI